MRILVAGLAWPMETFVERLLTGLAARDHVITIRSRDRPSTTWLRTHGVAWEHDAASVGRARLRAQVQTNGYGDAARASLAEVRHRYLGGSPRRAPTPDVIYSPWLNALIADPGLFELDAPVVTSCRGSLVNVAPWDPNRTGYRADLRRVFDRSTLVHCVSHDIVGEAVSLGMDRAKARVVHPAVSPSVFRPHDRPARSSGPVRVAAVGSLGWVKDHEHGLVAIREAVDLGADLTLDIVGDGPDRQHLRYTVDDLDLGSRVVFRGRLNPDEVAGVLQEADIFLHTSSAEGMSNAVLEAMAAGLAVVTTDAGGMREAVRHGIDGFLVPVRGVEEMATALASLSGDPHLRDRMGASARRRVTSEFHLDGQITQFAHLLAEATDRYRCS